LAGLLPPVPHSYGIFTWRLSFLRMS